MIVFSREAPLDKEQFLRRYTSQISSDFRPARNRANRYLQDRSEMQASTFSGMGLFFAEHDLFAAESMGPVANRPQEHLGSTDRPIIAARRLMLRTIRQLQEGNDPLHVIRGPAANRLDHLVVISEVITGGTDWKSYWKTKVKE